MAELKELFEVTTKQMEPDQDSWREQQELQDRGAKGRKRGALTVAAVIGVAVVSIFAALNRSDGTRPGDDALRQPRRTPRVVFDWSRHGLRRPRDRIDHDGLRDRGRRDEPRALSGRHAHRVRERRADPHRPGGRIGNASTHRSRGRSDPADVVTRRHAERRLRPGILLHLASRAWGCALDEDGRGRNDAGVDRRCGRHAPLHRSRDNPPSQLQSRPGDPADHRIAPLRFRTGGLRRPASRRSDAKHSGEWRARPQLLRERRRDPAQQGLRVHRWAADLAAGSRPPLGANQRSTGFLEQRLTPEGVELLRSEIASSRLFGDELDLATHGPLDATPGSALERLVPRLTDPASWLPASAWVDREINAYVPSRSEVCGYGRTQRIERILSQLPVPASGLRAGGCSDVTTEEARRLAEALIDAGPNRAGREVSTGRSTSGTRAVQVDLDSPSRSSRTSRTAR